MPWIQYTGPLDRVEVPRHQIGGIGPDGRPGLPRETPVEVPQDVRDDLVVGHPEWADANAPAAPGEGD